MFLYSKLSTTYINTWIDKTIEEIITTQFDQIGSKSLLKNVLIFDWFFFSMNLWIFQKKYWNHFNVSSLRQIAWLHQVSNSNKICLPKSLQMSQIFLCFLMSPTQASRHFFVGTFKIWRMKERENSQNAWAFIRYFIEWENISWCYPFDN